MNSYKLGFSLIATIVILTVYWNSKPAAPITVLATPPPYNQHNNSASMNIATGIPTTTMPQPVPAPRTPTDQANAAALDTLLSELATTMQESHHVQQQIANLITADSSLESDELITQTYQARVDALSQQFETQLRKATSLAKNRTHAFIWQQVLLIGLEESTSNMALSMINGSLDPALFEEMLLTLSNSAIISSARYNLAFMILLPPETTYADTNQPPSTTPLHRATPRQQRILQFLEEHFAQETDPDVLNAYLHVYQTMSRDQHGLASATQFQQQLEIVRAVLPLDQYFNYRLQQIQLTDANADLIGLLRDMNTTPMSVEQRQSLLSSLSSTVVSTTENNPFPQEHQQLLLQYLASSLTPPTLQNRYNLYEYGNQAYAIEVLKHGTQAVDTYYQRVVDSTNPTEQIALLLGAAMGGDVLLNKLKQNVALRQQVDKQLKQAKLSAETQALLQEGLQMLYGEPTATPDAVSLEPAPEPEPTPDSELPAAQYPGY